MNNQGVICCHPELRWDDNNICALYNKKQLSLLNKTQLFNQQINFL
jgi:hypothetical protein